jgi:hypothetical protein
MASLLVLQETYPHLADAIPPVANLIRLMEKQKHPELCELEARIGVSIPMHERSEGGPGNKFISGVDKSFLARVLCGLETTNCWSIVRNWTQQVDRFYLMPSGLQVRTTNEGVGNIHDPETAACITTHMIKSDIAQHTFYWDTPPSETALHRADDGSLYDIRVSLKKEEPVLEDELQDRVDNISTVRLKQRKTFTYSSATRPGLHWNTDVTQLYQASSFVETVEKLKLGLVTSYELEVECQNPMEHLKQLGSDYERLATSLLLKAADAFQIRNEGMPVTSLEDTNSKLCLRS